MKAFDALVAVLKKAGKSLHVSEIYKRAHEEGLWESHSNTPYATVSSIIHSDIRKHGEKSTFIKTSPAIFSLRDANVQLLKSRRILYETGTSIDDSLYSYLDAAEMALEKFGNHKPMHYRDIVNIAIEQKWLNPELSNESIGDGMRSRLSAQHRRYKRNGNGRFIRTSLGYYGLTKWITERPQNNEQFNIDSIMSDGCFIAREEIEKILPRLEYKKNLILQGPPGTGKTWLAKRLAYALIGQKNKEQVRAVQFHPNISYEDFVRGYRPGKDRRLELVDGPFMKMIDTANKNTGKKYVIVIEEINRGNPAQIFGEMLTLLEASKRNEDEALELSYKKNDNERVYIPPNLYVIGTMNLADRSLALVDFALRRRFAFFDLEPVFGDLWKNWVNEKYQISENMLNEIEKRITELNDQISQDKTLGEQYRIGHSFFTPSGETLIGDKAEDWFDNIVDTEIAQHLREYWYDASDNKAKEAIEKLRFQSQIDS